MVDETHQETVETSVGDTVFLGGESGQQFLRVQERPEDADWSPPTSTALSGQPDSREHLRSRGDVRLGL